MALRINYGMSPFFHRLLTLTLILATTVGLGGCLGNPGDRQEKLHHIARWEDQRLAPQDSLLNMILDGDARVRLAATRSAGLIGRRENVSALLEVLDDPSLTIRAEACFSLGLLGGKRAVRTLQTMSADPHRPVRLAALTGLAQCEGGGPALLAATEATEEAVAAIAWDGLRNRLSDLDSTLVIAAIKKDLAPAPPAIQWRILRCAELLPDSTLIPVMAPFASSSVAQTRVHAYRALSHQKAPLALKAVLDSEPGLKSFHGRNRIRVRIAICRALGQIGPLALGTPSAQEPTAAAMAVARILITASTDQDPHLARVALESMALGAKDLPLSAAAAQRESLLPLWRIRMERAAAKFVTSPHRGVSRAAIGAWATLRGAGCADDLVRLLSATADPDQKIPILQALAHVHPDPLPILIPLARADRKPVFPGDLQAQPVPPVLRTAALEAVDQILFTRPQALPAGLDTLTGRRLVGDILRRASRDTDFVVAATSAGLLAHYPDSLTAQSLSDLWQRAEGPGRFEIQRGVIRGLAGMKLLAADTLQTAANRLCAAVLQSGFDSPDLRVRLESRATALATGLVAQDLVPSQASLRATLPATTHDPAQPALALPFKAPKVRCTTGRGSFTITLDGRLAPNTCTVLLDLIARGFYDDLDFHRVVPDFVIQGGDPRGDGWGGPGYTIRSEWSPTPFKRGVVGIAHDGKDTGGSQFFVTLSEQPHLNARYTVCGKVTSGMDVVDMIEVGDHFKLEVIP